MSKKIPECDLGCGRTATLLNSECYVCRSNMSYHMRQGLGHCEERVDKLQLYLRRADRCIDKAKRARRKRAA